MAKKLFIFILTSFIFSFSLFADPNEDKKNCLKEGSDLFNQKKYEEAITAFQKALTLSPSCAEAAYNIGATYHLMGPKWTKEAKEWYEKALSINPNFASAYYNLGVLAFHAKDYQTAADYFQKGISISPNDSDMQHALEFSQKELAKSIPKKPEVVFYPNLQVKLPKHSFRDPNKNSILDAEETATLSILLENTGKGPAYGVTVVSEIAQPNPELSIQEKKLGTLQPGDKQEVLIPLSASRNIKDDEIQLLLKVLEEKGYHATPVKITFKTLAFRAPKLVISIKKIDDTNGNKNGKIELGETIQVKVLLQNQGEGEAKNVKISPVLEDENLSLTQKEHEFTFDSLKPKAQKEITFRFSIHKQYQGSDVLPISFQISEDRVPLKDKLPLNLTLTKALIPVVEVPDVDVDIEKIPKFAQTVKQNAFALVIGIENYRDVEKVKYAVNDAKLVTDYLVGVLGFDETNIVSLYDNGATRGDIRTYLTEWFPSIMNQDAEFFFYFAGHGAADPDTGKAYLVPYEGDGQSLEKKAYALDDLYQDMAKLPATFVTIIIDACYSGGGRSITTGRDIVKVKDFPEFLAKRGVLFSAAQANQISLAFPQKKHGLFTYFFLKGLHGNADQNRDGKLYAHELYQYVKYWVVRESKRQKLKKLQVPYVAPEEGILKEKALLLWEK